MSSKSQVKEIIDAYIHRNGNQEITGNILNRVLVAMLDAGVIDIIQDGAILPKDEDGNVVIPDFSMDGAVRYDIEQTLTEIEKELARRNIGAVDANFVGREVQDVYSALAGMITSEKNRAIGVENGLRSDLTAEIQRASTEELRIAGLVGALYTNAQIDAFLAPKMERVELAMFASQTPLKITYKGQTTALTFEQIKTLVQNTAKFVTLLVDEAYYLIPSLDYYDDAVQFVGTNILTGQAEAVRVMINSSNFVSCYAIELEDSGHKVSSMENILPYDQYIKYPNVKAVIDYVSAHGGGLTPEQEAKLNDAVTARDAEGSGVPALPFATKAEVGNLADLQTTDKSNIVNAINEVAQGGESDELIAEWHYPIDDYPPIVFSSYDSTTGYFYCDNIPSWATDGMYVCVEITNHNNAANTIFIAGNQKAVISINIIDEHHISLTGATIPSSVDVSAFRLIYIVNSLISIPSSSIKQEGDELFRIELIDISKNISKYGDGVTINCNPSIINGSSPSGTLPEIGYDVARPISSITTDIVRIINGGKDGYEQISTKQYCLKRTNQTTFTTSFIFASSYGVYTLWGYSSTRNDIHIHIDGALCLPTSSIKVYKIKNAYEIL